MKTIHAAQDFPYSLPDLANSLFVTRIVLTDDEKSAKKILGAALLRLTAEAYLLLDPAAGSSRQRWQSLLTLHEAARQDAARCRPSGLATRHRPKLQTLPSPPRQPGDKPQPTETSTD